MELGVWGFFGWPSCEGCRGAGAGVGGKDIQTFPGLPTVQRLLLLVGKLCLRPAGPLVTQWGSHPSYTALPSCLHASPLPMPPGSALVSWLPGTPFPHSAQQGLLILYFKRHEPPCFFGVLVIRCRPRPRLSWLAQGAAPLAARRPSPAARTKQRWCLLWGERPREQEQDQRSAPTLGLSCQQARHLAPLSMQSVLQTGPAFAVRRHPCLEGCLDEMGHSQCGCMFKFLFLLFSC